jgi:hypothetical protein
MSLLTQYDADARAVRRMTRRFLLVAVLATIALVAAIFGRQGLLRQTVSYSFVADSAQDIAKGQAVRIAGFRVGSVTEVSLRDDGAVAVGMEVDADQARFVTHDARIELRKEGLVGSPTLEIVPGPDKTRLAPAQARLAFSRADGLGALANQVRDEFVPILKDIKAITAALADQQKGLPGTLAQIRASSEALNVLLANGNRQVEGIGGTAVRLLGQGRKEPEAPRPDAGGRQPATAEDARPHSRSWTMSRKSPPKPKSACRRCCATAARWPPRCARSSAAPSRPGRFVTWLTPRGRPR